VTTCGQPLSLLKLLRRSGPPLTPVNRSALASGRVCSARWAAMSGRIVAGMLTVRVVVLP
jgi:hypothetical protein